MMFELDDMKPKEHYRSKDADVFHVFHVRDCVIVPCSIPNINQTFLNYFKNYIEKSKVSYTW